MQGREARDAARVPSPGPPFAFVDQEFKGNLRLYGNIPTGSATLAAVPTVGKYQGRPSLALSEAMVMMKNHAFLGALISASLAVAQVTLYVHMISARPQ